MQYLRSFTEEVDEYRKAKSEIGYSYIYAISDSEYPGYLEFHVSDGIVKKIFAGLEGQATLFQLNRLFIEYGKPSEVLLLYGWMGEVGILQLYLLLFYPEKGFLTLYIIESQQVDDMYRSCPQGIGPDELYLWSPEDELKLSDVYGPIEGFKSLEEVTGMDIATFYQVFSDPASQACLEAPAR